MKIAVAIVLFVLCYLVGGYATIVIFDKLKVDIFDEELIGLIILCWPLFIVMYVLETGYFFINDTGQALINHFKKKDKK
jgi:hypothetical protein